MRGTDATELRPAHARTATLLTRQNRIRRTPRPREPANSTALRLNLRTRVYRHFDSAGVVTNARLDANGNPVEAYDFKGNLLRSTRRLAADLHRVPDWLAEPARSMTESFRGQHAATTR